MIEKGPEEFNVHKEGSKIQASILNVQHNIQRAHPTKDVPRKYLTYIHVIYDLKL